MTDGGYYDGNVWIKGDTMDPHGTYEGTLYNVLVAYLVSKGFHQATNGFWGHRELGEGRTFEQVVRWQMGREEASEVVR